MNLLIQPFTPADARLIRTWRYPAPFDLYNWTSADEASDLRYFLDPANQFHSVHNAVGVLIGFCSFGQDAQVPGGDYTPEALDIGLGLNPTYIGQGLGTGFLGAILELANAQWQPPAFRATIAKFNQPSQRIFAKHGFVETAQFLSTGTHALEFVVVMR